jgi:hypothetical protein
MYFRNISFTRQNTKDLLVQKYFVKGLVFKICGGLIYALLVVFYWGFGDTSTYFKEVLFFRELLATNKISLYQIFTQDYSYFRDTYQIVGSINNSGFMVTKIALLISYLSFSRFLITTILFTVIAYSSLFTLFKTFVAFIPRYHFPIALTVLFFPSVSIYGSGILKDTVSFTALGFFFYAAYEMAVKKNLSVKYLIILFISGYFIAIVKSYILAAFLLPFMLFFIIKLIKGLKSTFAKLAVSFSMLMVIIILVISFSTQIEEAMGVGSTAQLQSQIMELQNEYSKMTENSDSNFSLGTIEPTVAGLMKKLPAGFVATLYRPFIWEARSLFTLISSLESLFLLLFTLYVIVKVNPVKIFYILISNSNVFLCIGFSIIFASLVGLSTLNFGTLARYRIPVIPFYLMGLLMISYEAKKAKLKKLL